MEINARSLAYPHLREIDQIAAPRLPLPMPDAAGLRRRIALEEQDRFQKAVTGRVAVKQGYQIGPRRRGQIGVIFMGLIGDFAQNLLLERIARNLSK